jgi:ketosteroid isomerase-like protein
MKGSIPKFSRTVMLPLLFALLWIVFYSSCSKPNLGDIVREHIQAVNSGDIEKNLTLFTDDIVFEIYDDAKLTGKNQLRGMLESDVANKALLTINDVKVQGDVVIVAGAEKNEGYRLLKIEEAPFKAIYKFRGRFIEKVKLEGTPEGTKLWEEKFKAFVEWAKKKRPQEFMREETGGYSAENARLFLSLLKEWRDQTDTKSVSVEQELIKLENESNDAWVKHDVEAYARLLGDDYLCTGPDGDMSTKAQDLAELKENTTTSAIADDFRVRVYGDAAVVTFRLTYKNQSKVEESTGQERFTDTWIKRDGRWQCVAVHYSTIPQK